MVADIHPSDNGGASQYPFTVYDNKLVFAANDSINGNELWISDGSSNGTYMVKDLSPGQVGNNVNNSDPAYFTIYNDLVYFSATANFVRGLWVTDGTNAGTHEIKPYINPGHFIVFENKLFFSAEDNINGRELWCSDGTAAGTHLLKNIHPLSGSSDPFNFKVMNNKLYFTANDGVYGNELWVTDGTSMGTTIVADINTLPNIGSHPSSLTVFNNHLIFNAGGIEGFELWISDGTAAGTQLLKNINTQSNGEGDSQPSGFTPFNNKLFFAAHNLGLANLSNLYVTDGTNTGTLLVGAVNPTFVGEINGALIIGAKYANAPGTQLYKITPNTSKIEDKSELNFSIFPNPVQNYLMVQTNRNDLEFDIIDARGISCIKLKTKSGIHAIDVEKLSRGTYFIKEIKSGNVSKFTKL